MYEIGMKLMKHVSHYNATWDWLQQCFPLYPTNKKIAYVAVAVETNLVWIATTARQYNHGTLYVK